MTRASSSSTFLKTSLQITSATHPTFAAT
jgi:hypothetical protein